MRLDAQDKAILYHLELDSRMPVSHIGENVGLSKDSVKYRIRNLEKLGFLVGFSSLIDIMKIGFQGYVAYLRLGKLKQRNRIVRYLERSECVGEIRECSGGWDIVFHSWVKKSYGFESFLLSFLKSFGSSIAERNVKTLLEKRHYGRDYLFDRSVEGIVFTGNGKTEQLDSVDYKVLKLISSNPRIRITEISESVGMVSDAVKKRINKLVKKEIIRAHRPLLNPGVNGYGVYGVCFRFSSIEESELIKHLKKKRNIVECNRYLGNELELRVESKGEGELKKTVDELRNLTCVEVVDHRLFSVYNESKGKFTF